MASTRPFIGYVAAAERRVMIAALLGTAAAASLVASAGAVHAAPRSPAANAIHEASHEVEAYGDPSAAAPYWRQQHSFDCGELAVADVVGQITGHEPGEEQITALAQSTSSTAGPGPILKPTGGTDIHDLPVLLAHYRIKSDNIQTSITALEQDLLQNRRVIVLLNAETIWNRPGQRNAANHFVVVTGINPKAGVVHLNDSGIVSGRDEQVPIARFGQAWAINHHSAIVTA
jgi:predicted double-glycine peptidase